MKTKIVSATFVFCFIALSAAGATRTWKGGTSTTVNKVNLGMLASTPENWNEGEAPVDGDVIVFDATGATNPCRWDLNVKPASWTQTADYANTVTFATTYDDTGLPFVEVTGNVVLNGGTWTHLANGGLNRTYRLYVKVGGDMTIGTDAKVTAYGLGYQNQYMAKGGTFSGTKIYATHGGFGYENTATWPLGGNGAVPYGKIQAPEEPGSGSNSTKYLGGGSIRLDVAGLLTVDGVIDANALKNANYTGAGGSVYLRVGTIAGSGSVEANSMTTGVSCGNGSGGRVAIILTKVGATFDAFDPQVRCSAYSGTLGSSVDFGQPGTIYVETPQDTPNEGWLIIKSASTASANKYCNMTPVASYDDDMPAKYARITTINNGAAVFIPDYATVDSPVDMTAMTAANFEVSVVKLAGGAWKPPFSGDVPYSIVSYDGLDGVLSSQLNITDGGSLEIAWTATKHYKGDMTIAAGGTVKMTANPLLVDGDLTVEGTIGRTESSAPVNPLPIEVDVTGDLTVGASGVISAEALGWGSGKCPLDQTYSGKSGSHGGWGWATTAVSGGPSGVEPYGSIKNPESFGAGGTSQRGGGVVKLLVGGMLTNNGTVTANAKSAGYYEGSGGSVNVCAGELAGTGCFSADTFHTHNGAGYSRSAGGRVAIRLTGPNAGFSAFTGIISAHGAQATSPVSEGTTPASVTGSAGTIWLGTSDSADGTLLVDNGFSGLNSYFATLVGGTFMAADELSYCDVLVGRSACLQLAADKTLTVSGVFSNGCEFVAGDGSTLAFAGTTPSVLYGDVTLCNLSCQTPGKVISVAPGATVTVTGAADLTGGAGNRIVMKSLADGEKWNLVGSAIVMNGVALKDCVSESPITVLDGEDLGGNSANITFMGAVQGELLTWTGESDGAWANAANWDVGRAPIAADDIVIPTGCPNMPSLAGDVTVVNLTVEEGSSLALAGRNLTVNGNAAVSGALVASGSEVISVVSNLTLASSFVSAQSTVRLAGPQARTLTIAAGTVFATLDLGVGTVSVAGDVKADALTVGDGATAFAVTFGSGATVDVNSFTARGDVEKVNGALMAADGGVWNLIASVPSVTGVMVTGSDASDGVTVVPTACTDGGRNVNWLFVDNRTHWDGSSWSDGEPTADKDAVVDAGATLVVFDAGAVRNLTVSPNAVLRVNAADFSVGGALTIEPSGMVEWNEPGSVAGKLTMLKDSVLTHGVNTAATHTNRICLTIGGSGYIAAGATVDACGKQAVATVAGAGAAHGGCKGSRSIALRHEGICYGSILHPESVGGLGNCNAGGAIRLTFSGGLKLDGEINADAAYMSGHYGSAGGSVWLTAASVTGTGSIHADGNVVEGIDGGGGGRVAIYLTEETTVGLGAKSVHVWGGRSVENANKGGAGTYYLETPADRSGQGTLTIADIEGKIDGDYGGTICTDYPVSVGGDDPQAISRVNMVVKHCGRVYLTGDASVGSLSILDNTSKIHLNGHHLRVHAYRPKDWDDSRVDAGEGGTIDWNIPGLMLIVK